MEGAQCRAGTELDWTALAAYLTASAAESEATVHALRMRLGVSVGTLARANPGALPGQKLLTPPRRAHTKLRTTATQKKKKKRTRRPHTTVPRAALPCDSCRTRHRRCDAVPGAGGCTGCSRAGVACSLRTRAADDGTDGQSAAPTV